MLDEVLEIHKKNVGVLRMETTEAVQDDQDLAKMYTPGVAELSLTELGRSRPSSIGG